MSIDIRKPLRKYLPFLLRAQEENLNEADTAQRIVKVFEEVLGYDVMTEITREKQIREKYVDITIKINGITKFLVEVKAAGVTLRDRHIDQAERYAAEGNVRWVVLTNGVAWNLYHLEFEEGIEYVRVFTFDLSSDPFDNAAEMLSLLHRQSIIKGDHEKFWECRVALSPDSIGKALFEEEVLRTLRRLIRKSEKVLIDIEDIAQALHNMLSTEARELIGPMRIRRKHKPKEKQLTQDELPAEQKECGSPSLIKDQNIEVGQSGEEMDKSKSPLN
jgi:predicted type IV restriction endonuclease